MLPFLAVAAMTTVAGCPVFPASNPWNEDVSKLPVAARSAAYVKSIGLAARLHPDFASRTYGIPFAVVPKAQKRVPIRFTDYPRRVRQGAVSGAAGREGRGWVGPARDRRAARDVQAVRAVRRRAHGAGAGARATARCSTCARTGCGRRGGRRPTRRGCRSSRGSRAPTRSSAGGAITHALRVTVPRTQKAYISPARHFASSDTDPDLPPMGLRLRLKACVRHRGASTARRWSS